MSTSTLEKDTIRRSLTTCEPSFAFAGQKDTWHFIYTPSSKLDKGARLRFDMRSMGRDIDWELPSTNLRKKENVIFLVTPEKKIVEGREVELPESFCPVFEFTLPAEVKPGKDITISVGAPKDAKEKALKEYGNTSQQFLQRRRTFMLSIDHKGKGNFEEPELFSMDVRGNKLDHIRIIAPTYVAKNKRFDVVVRFEDCYGNLTGRAEEGTLISLTHEHLRENLNWKLFVPETGFIALPNLYFNEEGVYRICLNNLKTKQSFRSAPIKCYNEFEGQLFWGQLHGESVRYDSAESIENCLRYFRDDESLNFYGCSTFDDAEETSNTVWKTVSQNVSEFNEPDRYCAFLGLQWIGEPGIEGLRHFIFSGDNKPILRQKDAKFSCLKKIYKSFAPKDLVSIMCFTMGKGTHFDFEDHNGDFERLGEIYNAWGSCECTEKEGNHFPIKSSGKKGIKEAPEGSFITALNKNCRFGFVAGGLDDRGAYSEFFDNDQDQYSPGLTAIVAQEYTRESLYNALYARSCYATTGERIALGFSLVGSPMGSELNSKDRPGLHINRHISGFAAGTAPLTSVEVIRNGKVCHKVPITDPSHIIFTFDDMCDLKDCVIDGGKVKPPFCYYFLRITQADGHRAWSSPIWIDYHKK